MASANEFARPIQELVTEYCWGEVWTRPGLSPRDRSLLNLGMLAALGRSHELGVHVRGAVSNGLTREEIQEALLQVAVYAGVPAGMEAFRVAESTLDQIASEDQDRTEQTLDGVALAKRRRSDSWASARWAGGWPDCCSRTVRGSACSTNGAKPWRR
jgi:4-carboxymuconolactone decarboxylase